MERWAVSVRRMTRVCEVHEGGCWDCNEMRNEFEEAALETVAEGYTHPAGAGVSVEEARIRQPNFVVLVQVRRVGHWHEGLD